MPFIAPNRDPEIEPPPKEMEIDTGLGKRVFGWIAYIVLVLLVAGVFVALFIHFTGSLRLAVALVGFMLTYMAIMGVWASRNYDRRD
jgi:hypothetical protein